MDDMDDVLESGGWRTHSTCHCHCRAWCGVTNHQHHCLSSCLFFCFFQKYPQSLFHFQHMTLSHWCYRPPHPAMAPPVRRLRRSSARRSDPTRAGSARITVTSETVWTTAISTATVNCCIFLTIFIYFLLQVQGNHGLSSQVHLTLLFPGGRRRLIVLAPPLLSLQEALRRLNSP